MAARGRLGESTTTEFVLLGTAGAPIPMPVSGRGRICSVVRVDQRIFMIDCGRGTPTAFVEADLDFTRLDAVFVTHLHVDHTGDLTGMLLNPWGLRAHGDGRPPPPVEVHGPAAPSVAPDGDATFHRTKTIQETRPSRRGGDEVLRTSQLPGKRPLTFAQARGKVRRTQKGVLVVVRLITESVSACLPSLPWLCTSRLLRRPIRAVRTNGG
jgi:ribonuclease BN (tRNA processing enzyme)